MKKILVSVLTLLIISTSSMDAQNRKKRVYKHNTHKNKTYKHNHRHNNATDLLLPMVIGGLIYSLIQDDEVAVERPCPYVEKFWVQGYWKTGPFRMRWFWVQGYWQERLVQCNTYYYR